MRWFVPVIINMFLVRFDADVFVITAEFRDIELGGEMTA